MNSHSTLKQRQQRCYQTVMIKSDIKKKKVPTKKTQKTGYLAVSPIQHTSPPPARLKASSRRSLTFQTTPHITFPALYPTTTQYFGNKELYNKRSRSPSTMLLSTTAVSKLVSMWSPPKNESNRTLEVLLCVIQHLYTNIEDLTERASPSGRLKAFDQLLNLPNFHVPVRCAGVVRHLPRAVWTC